jgi:hypothetical protein
MTRVALGYDVAKLPMNWKSKVAVQFVLSKLPGGERLNHGLQWMNGNYTPMKLRERLLARLPIYERITRHVGLKDATVVEIGTGWELLDPLLMFAFGSERIYTYDHVRHLRFPIPRMISREMQGLKDLLVSRGADPNRIDAVARAVSLEDLLALAKIHYKAPGDGTATALAKKSVDLFFSISVLEHVAPAVVFALIAESRRVLKPSGMGFHIIDPGDHYAPFGVSKVNFLQYSDRLWDFWVQNKISYHNRLRARQFIEAFENQGAQFKSIETKTAESDVALLRNGFKIDRRFWSFNAEDLAVYYCEVIHTFNRLVSDRDTVQP